MSMEIPSFSGQPRNKKEALVVTPELVYEQTTSDVPLTSERALVLLSDPQPEYLDLVLERIRHRAFEPSEEVRARIKSLLH